MQNTFESTVRTMSLKGLGVVDHPDGKVYFVRGVWPGDKGSFRVTKSEKRYGFAELVELKINSPERVEAACKYLGTQVGQCGGCPWMVASYESQLKVKTDLVLNLIKRNELQTSETQILPIQGSSQSLGYRNRAQLKTDGVKLGYVSPESHQLADIGECIIMTPKLQKQFAKARAQLPSDEWSEVSEKHKWNLLELNDESDAIEINRKLPFKQGNSEQNSFMKNWLAKNLESFDKKSEVLELFSGSGNFTEVLSACGFSKVTAFEVSKTSIEELNQKELPNVKGYALNINDSSSWKQIASSVTQPKILVLDPPREGFKEIASFLKKVKSVETIIYISCDSSTWAQDARSLKGLNYELQSLQPLDQFPNTPHIEILSILSRK